jgi:protoporphyrin/coproporphyrin ferrochelatase
MAPYQALLVLSFGGPEKTEDVMPFLENVLRGKRVPRDRMLEVAEHYYHFGGRSPINDQNRELIAALEHELQAHGPRIPVYWGNRNWRPFLADTLSQMQADGIDRALVFVTSAFGSYSGCRQYREDIERARAEQGSAGPQLHKLPGFHLHPGFIGAIADRIRALDRPDADLIFTAHSIPMSMAETSPYVRQLHESCSLVARELGRERWELAYQSRSGPPTQPWLEPDIAAVLRRYQGSGKPVIVSPIGFISDHMEVLYDLDTEANALADELGVEMLRAGTPGVHPLFISMIRDLVASHMEVEPPVCPADCCPAPTR